MGTPVAQTNPSWPRLLVIPAYNEEQNLPRLFADLERRRSLYTPGSRIFIVDDGSQDGTASVVGGYRVPLPVELVRMGKNGGPGAAFARGFGEALAAHPGEAFVITLEADNTSDLDALDPMLACAADGAGLVLASVHGGGRMLNVTRSRRILSTGAGVAVRRALALDARTVSSFFRVYRASVLRTAVARHGDRLIQERGFACKAELLVKLTALGVTVAEVPVDLDASRREGASKMPVLRTLIGYGRLFVRERLQRASAKV
jgi:dolichol-phosphate mannosyltransferase